MTLKLEWPMSLLKEEENSANKDLKTRVRSNFH